MICRRKFGHAGDHAWGTLKARSLGRNLELAAQASDLLMRLPEGDYTSLVKKVYINGRVVLIEFNTPIVTALIEGRKRG